MAFISIMMNPQIKFIVERCKWETIYPTAKALNASIELKPDYPALEFQNTVCAHFHCHTTLQYCPSYVSRETGPSIGDINFANSQQLPGILYDYEDAKIYGGDSKDKKYKMQTFGEYAQRPDRIY